MSIRRVARTVAVSIAAVSAAGAFSILTLSGTAGAAAPTDGSSVPNSAVAVGTVTPGTPFSSGQQINIVIPVGAPPGLSQVQFNTSGFSPYSVIYVK